MTKCLKLKVYYIADFLGLSIVHCTSIMCQYSQEELPEVRLNHQLARGKSKSTVRETLIRNVPTVKSQKFGIWLKDINRLSQKDSSKFNIVV